MDRGHIRWMRASKYYEGGGFGWLLPESNDREDTRGVEEAIDVVWK
jgi:hypothetical protein